MRKWLVGTYAWFCIVALTLFVVGSLTAQMSLIGAIGQHYVDAYDAAIMADSPLGYWKMNDRSGSTLADSSGNTRSGTYTGSPTLGATGFLDSETDTAVTLNGTSQYASVAHGSWMDTSSFTAMVWFKTTDTGTIKVLLTRYDATNGSEFQITITNGVVIFTTFNVNTGTTVATSTDLYNDGRRHCAAVTYTGGTGKLYVDGTRTGATSSLTVTTSSNSAITIGARTGGSFFVPATVEKVAYFGTALSQARLVIYYQLGSPGPVRLQVAYGTSATTVAFPQATLANSLLLLDISCQNNSSVTNSVTTPTGWTAGPTGVATNGTQRGFAALMYKIAAGSDADPTYVITGANTTRTILEEWSGLATSSPVDITFTGGAGGSGTIHIGANTTTNASDWIYALACGRTNLTITWGGGQVAAGTNTGGSNTCATSVQTVTATGSYDPTAAFSSGAIAGVAVAFKRAAA